MQQGDFRDTCFHEQEMPFYPAKWRAWARCQVLLDPTFNVRLSQFIAVDVGVCGRKAFARKCIQPKFVKYWRALQFILRHVVDTKLHFRQAFGVFVFLNLVLAIWPLAFPTSMETPQGGVDFVDWLWTCARGGFLMTILSLFMFFLAGVGASVGCL